MIKQLTNFEEASPILKEYFHSYTLTEDPFEKIAIYTDKSIIGIISYSIIYERGEINYLITLSEYRNQGIGGKLIEYAIQDIKNNKCKSISLEVKEENIEAIKLYLKYGFKIKANRENYYGDSTAHLMIKEIEVIE